MRKLIIICLGLTLAAGMFFAYHTKRAFAGPTFSLEKKTFRDDYNTPTATFEPSETVIVLVKILTGATESVSLRLNDYFPIDSKGKVAAVPTSQVAAKCGTDLGNPLGGSFSIKDGGYLEWKGEVSQSSYLCYSYQIFTNPEGGDQKEGKNLNIPVDTILYKTGPPEEITASLSSYILVRGFAPANSLTDPTTLVDHSIFPIEDQLVRNSVLYSGKDTAGELQFFSNWNAYVYDKGQGSRSRGGDLLQLPVSIYDSSGSLLATAANHLLFNPVFYLFGNIYSKLGGVGRALDMGSRGLSVHSSEALTANNAQEDLNSRAALYNYQLDKNSVMFWDLDNPDKNVKMKAIIGRLIGPPLDPVVCSLTSIIAIQGGTLNLDNQNCQISQPSNNTYPDGRIWYLSGDVVGTSSIEINGTIHGKGTIIIDYSQAGTAIPTVKISTSTSDFPDQDNSSLGLIVINGGQVEFGENCQLFKGIVFAPGSQTNPDTGSIIFAGGDSAFKMKIFGSIVADKINFASRGKASGSALYSVAIYSDATILNSPPPGFSEVVQVLGAK